MKCFSAILAAVLLFAADVKAQTTNTLSDVEIKGRELAQQICDAWPTENFINNGDMKVRDANGKLKSISVKIELRIRRDRWSNQYQATSNNIPIADYVIVHGSNSLPTYVDHSILGLAPGMLEADKYASFAGSDFWLADLGLEFFHWPAQKILPKTTNLKRGREYTLLESTNPNPPTNGYSRVLSWIDKESGGILQAEAYDAQGKLLKVFEPKSFKKVNGQWELQEMEIRNVQTGSRTRLEFDLKKN